jgi:hypothetical protein
MIGGEGINEALSNNSNNNKNKEQRTTPSKRNKRGQSSASSAKVHTSQTIALSANNQPIKMRALTKKKDMLTQCRE